MTSMTGYGYAEFQNDEASVSVEFKGCNNRYLEIAVTISPLLSSLETKIREYVAKMCRRGTIEISVRYRERKAQFLLTLNKEAANAYYNAAKELAAILGYAGNIPLEEILKSEGVVELEKNRNADRAWELIFPVLEKAAADFSAERKREGEATKADILKNLSLLEKSLELIDAQSGAMDGIIKANVKNRFAELLGDNIDENRILAETAALLVKYTISEEVSRLASHFAEFRAEAETGDAVGKKLDFLSQEVNREINTIGSKSTLLEISREVVSMKNALENIREQLRNVE